MNQDAVYQRLREISWRRPLTEAEQAELRAWLVAHPEAQPEAEADELLNAALARLPEAPLSSNFTARVLQAIESDTARAQPAAPPHSPRRWRVFLPRFAVAALIVIGGGTMAYRHVAAARYQELVAAAQKVPPVDPRMMTDFDVIASLSPPMAVADEKLLALSDELLALGQ